MAKRKILRKVKKGGFSQTYRRAYQDIKARNPEAGKFMSEHSSMYMKSAKQIDKLPHDSADYRKNLGALKKLVQLDYRLNKMLTETAEKARRDIEARKKATA